MSTGAQRRGRERAMDNSCSLGEEVAIPGRKYTSPLTYPLRTITSGMVVSRKSMASNSSVSMTLALSPQRGATPVYLCLVDKIPAKAKGSFEKQYFRHTLIITQGTTLVTAEECFCQLTFLLGSNNPALTLSTSLIENCLTLYPFKYSHNG